MKLAETFIRIKFLACSFADVFCSGGITHNHYQEGLRHYLDPRIKIDERSFSTKTYSGASVRLVYHPPIAVKRLSNLNNYLENFARTLKELTGLHFSVHENSLLCYSTLETSDAARTQINLKNNQLRLFRDIDRFERNLHRRFLEEQTSVPMPSDEEIESLNRELLNGRSKEEVRRRLFEVKPAIIALR